MILAALALARSGSVGADGAAGPCKVADVAWGCEDWSFRFNDRGNSNDLARGLAVGPDGARIFTLSRSWGGSTGHDYVTLARNATGGSALWEARYDAGAFDYASAIAVSPDGSTVFVTGEGSGSDIETVAYDALTGETRWFNTTDSWVYDRPFAMAVSPDGSRVFITGEARDPYFFSRANYWTIAIDALTGYRLWGSVYAGAAADWDSASDIAVSPDSGTVFVTGRSDKSPGGSDNYDALTVAYDAATGARRWVASYAGPEDKWDAGWFLAVDPGGSRVYVAGTSDAEWLNGDPYPDVTVVAYDAASGGQVWARSDAGPRDDGVAGIAVSPDGSLVYVTGTSEGDFVPGPGPCLVVCAVGPSRTEFVTSAYDSSTGALRWAATYDAAPSGPDVAGSLDVSPDGERVYVTGSSASPGGKRNAVTVAYDAESGHHLWVTRHSGSPAWSDEGRFVRSSPDGLRLYVAGASYATSTADVLGLAYDAGDGPLAALASP